MRTGYQGQSTLEYLVLVTAVVVVVLAYAGVENTGFQGTLKDTMSNATDAMSSVAGTWTDAMKKQ